MEINNKLREALKKILDLTNSLDEDCAVDPVEIRDIAKAALAEPVKNCDVGTAKEQTRRFSEFCGNYDLCMTEDCKCPLLEKLGSCEFEWGQMPYEEGGAK